MTTRGNQLGRTLIAVAGLAAVVFGLGVILADWSLDAPQRRVDSVRAAERPRAAGQASAARTGDDGDDGSDIGENGSVLVSRAGRSVSGAVSKASALGTARTGWLPFTSYPPQSTDDPVGEGDVPPEGADPDPGDAPVTPPNDDGSQGRPTGPGDEPSAPFTPSQPAQDAPAAPSAPPAQPFAAPQVVWAAGGIAGRVTHEVWGYPVPGARVVLVSTGTEAYTDAAGWFRFEGLLPSVARATPVYIVALDPGAGWRTHSSSVALLSVPQGASVRADFGVYRADEAAGDLWRSSGWWRNWRSRMGADTMESIVAKVSAASSEFSRLTADGVRDASGSADSRRDGARACLLAMWLGMASGGLGFDAPVDVSHVGGWQAFVPSGQPNGCMTVLGLARDIESVFERGVSTDSAWDIVRRCCSSSVSDQGSGGPAASGTSPGGTVAGGGGAANGNGVANANGKAAPPKSPPGRGLAKD